MAEESVERVFDQAAAFVQRVVDAYDRDVAPGEVGRDGSGVASHAPPTKEGGTNGLLYGRVQSGKTVAMIAATALALDNGFRLVVVLTANNVTLVRQTAERFRNLEGVQVQSTATDGPDYEWEGQEADLAEDLAEEGLVLVCAKESTTHLRNVVRLLQELDAAGHPALVFDDEADAATPDTTLAARTLGRPNAPQYPSPTFRHVVENEFPGEEGASIRAVLPHHVFVPVTATPFILFLQRGDSPLRPNFVETMEPGEGYRGGEEFFGGFTPYEDVPNPPIVLVSDREAQQLQAARRHAPAPAGLHASVAFFLLAASAHAMTVGGGTFPAGGYKHLSHTSPRQAQHDFVADVLKRLLRGLRRQLRANRDDARTTFGDAYEELRRTEGSMAGPLPSLEDLLEFLHASLSRHQVIKVNANSGELRYGPTYNFVVGGNILGRGVTIDDLLVTYYLREAQVSQMDTVWQHARMYGYRAELMPFTRVYLPRRLASIFRGIHEVEEDLRAVLPSLEEGAPVPLQVVTGTRPTRPNALQPNAVQVYSGGRQVRPLTPVTDPNLVAPAQQAILARLEALNVPTTATRIDDRFVTVSIDDLIALARMVPVDPDDPGRWNTDGVEAVLRAVADQFDGQGDLYVRSTTTERDANGLPTGVLTGDEQRRAVQRGRPTLALVYRTDGEPRFPPFWFPTLVLPNGMRPVVFNAL
jgi:hypothetical protein